MGPDVFISHSPADDAVARQVCEFLEAQDIRCWMAPRDVPPGKDAGEAVTQGIRAAAITVLIFSRNANDSESVRLEVDQAVQAQKVLIPFRIEKVPATGEMEAYFRRRYWHEAHIPPLEQHLEELVRTLKPLTQKGAMNTMDESSISRTLPSRSSIVRRSDGAVPTAAHASEGPVRVSFQFNHVVVAGHFSTVEFSLANCGPAILNSVEIVLESRGLKRPLVRSLTDLGPGEERRGTLDLEPLRAGRFPLHVTVKARDGARETAWLGLRSFRVNEVPGSDFLNEMRAMLGNAEPAEGAASPLATLASSGTVQNLNDLLNAELPGPYEPVELDWDYEVSLPAAARAGTARPLQIPTLLLDQVRPGTVLVLEPVGTPTVTPHQGIRLVSRPTFGLGRAREESDFLVRFWPRNEIHDTKTRRISKKHCTLTASRGRIYVGNTAAASLTGFDDQDVAGPEGVILERRGIINLSGIYFVEALRFPSSCPRGPEISNLDEIAPAERQVDAVTAAERGSVRFVAMNPHVLPQNSTWLLTDATFGTSRFNPVVLESENLDEVQGRFHHHLGAFWIENFLDNGAVQVNGAVLSPGFIAPLAGGAQLRLGRQRFHVQVTT